MSLLSLLWQELLGQIKGFSEIIAGEIIVRSPYK